jgi:hypothetical protein
VRIQNIYYYFDFVPSAEELKLVPITKAD